MYLLVAIGCFILAALINGGKDQPEWKREGYSTYGEYDKARKGGRREWTFSEHYNYYFRKAYDEWEDPKWTTPEQLSFLRKVDHSSYIDCIAMKMAYDDGLCPCDDLRKFNPDNPAEPFWRAREFEYKKWIEEGILIHC